MLVDIFGLHQLRLPQTIGGRLCCLSQDYILPLCCDERFADDTLFLIFEEDYRFAPEDDHPSWTMHGRRDLDTVKYCATQCINKKPAPDLSPPPDSMTGAGASSSAASAIPDAGAQSSTNVPAKKHRDILHGSDFASNISKAKGGHEWSEPSIFLRDLMAYFNVAAKKGR